MGVCVCGERTEEGAKLCERCASLQILGLDARATHDEIRAAYRVLAKALQGDQFQEDETLREAAAKKLKAIEAAYFSLHEISSDAHLPQSFYSNRSPIVVAPPPPAVKTPAAKIAAASAPPPVRELFSSYAEAEPDEEERRPGMPPMMRKILIGIIVVCLAIIGIYLASLIGCERVNRGMHDLGNRSAAIAGLDDAKGGKAKPSPKKQGKPQPGKSQNAPTKIAPYITVGLTMDEVLAIEGVPSSSSPNMLTFGTSELYFKDSRVVGWKIDPSSSPLRVKLWPESPVDTTLEYFTVGSSKNDVVTVQGTPTMLSEEKFAYGRSEVYFENNRVVSWKNDPGSVQLRAKNR